LTDRKAAAHLITVVVFTLDIGSTVKRGMG